VNRFVITDLPLPSLKRVEHKRIADERGYLERIFCTEELRSAGWAKPVAQINHSYSATKGTVRGLHFQKPPHAEMKLVSCIRGEVWDVAVDVRKGSKTFLRWHAERLSAESPSALLIPEGFAHGFQTLTDGVELLYCHSSPYIAASECALHPSDPMLAIAWPLPITQLSARDAQHKMLDENFDGVAT